MRIAFFPAFIISIGGMALANSMVTHGNNADNNFLAVAGIALGVVSTIALISTLGGTGWDFRKRQRNL